jgi:hypothetical protein
VRTPRRIHGVDFSGARDAGRKIWIASGVIERGVLRLEECRPAEELAGSGRDRDTCLAALQNFIAGERACAFGLDFPFGLPLALVKEASWEEFVLAFPERYATPEEFRDACQRAAGGVELRRVTDLLSRTPFSPYNLRVYRQTYYGIRDLLAPLIRKRLARVPPMQCPVPGQPWILEICPASLLKRQKLYLPYKGGSEGHRAARARILREIQTATPVSLASRSFRSMILEDRDGDALDSVIAACGTFRALRHPPGLAPELNGAYAVEGYVYA